MTSEHHVIESAYIEELLRRDPWAVAIRKWMDCWLRSEIAVDRLRGLLAMPTRRPDSDEVAHVNALRHELHSVIDVLAGARDVSRQGDRR